MSLLVLISMMFLLCLKWALFIGVCGPSAGFWEEECMLGSSSMNGKAIRLCRIECGLQ